MRNKDFFSGSDAVYYLQNSIIRVNRKPVIVTGVREPEPGNYELHYRPLYHTKIKTIPLKNKQIDFTPIPTGFLSTDIVHIETPHALVVSRVPSHTSRIGLCEDNVECYAVSKEGMRWRKNNWVNPLSLRSLERTVLDRFYPWDVAYGYVMDEKVKSIGVSRSFAIDRRYLYYKYFTDPVGIIQDKHVALLPCFMYLKEHLMFEVKK